MPAAGILEPKITSVQKNQFYGAQNKLEICGELFYEYKEDLWSEEVPGGTHLALNTARWRAHPPGCVGWPCGALVAPLPRPL